MSEIKITDLVPQETIDKVKELDNELRTLVNTYTNTAKELAKGIDINVKVVGDLDKLEKLYIEKTREASKVTEQLSIVMSQQEKIIGDTTNTISRELMEKEKLNKEQREEYKNGAKVTEILEKVREGYKAQLAILVQVTEKIKLNKAEQAELQKQYKSGQMSYDEYMDKQTELIAQGRELAMQKSQLNQSLKMEEKANADATDSVDKLSHQLEMLKRVYKELDGATRESADGKELEATIQELDAALKDMSADIGEFQRNVGNYAIASSSLKKDLKELVLEIATLSMEYQNLSEEEQNSAEGQAMASHINELIERAGALRDAISDTNQAITNAASDTRTFDQLSGSMQLAIDGFGLATGAAEMLGISTGELAEIQTKLQAAIAASNAMQSIQNTLQSQSAVMQGVNLVQTKLRTTAENLHTLSVGKGVVATKALTVAQWGFNAAANANPIGLIIVLIVGAIAAVWGLIKVFNLFIGVSDDAVKAYEKQKKALDDMTEANERNIASMKARGATEAELLVQSLKNKQVEKEAAEKLFAMAKELYDDDEEEYIDALEAKKKADEDFETHKEDSLNYLRKVIHESEEEQKKKSLGTFEYKRQLVIAELEMQKELARTLLLQKKITQQVFEELVFSLDAAAKFKLEGIDKEEKKDNDTKNKKSLEAAKKQMEELRKAVQAGEDAMLNLITDSLERQRQAEQLAYSRKLKELKEQLSKVKSTELTLRTAILKQIEGLEAEHQQKLDSIRMAGYERQNKVEGEIIASHLALAKSGTDEELEWTLKQLSNRQQAELLALLKSENEKTITTEQAEEMRLNIVEKYAILREEAESSHANKVIEKIQERYGTEEAQRQIEYSKAVNALNKRYAKELTTAGNNAREQERLKRKLESDMSNLSYEYAKKSAESSISMLEEVLKADNLSAKDRLKYEQELAKARIALEKLMADNAVEGSERVADADSKSTQKKIANVQKWLQIASEAIGNINSLVSSVYDGQIEQMEEQQEANQEAGDREQERISELVDKKVITEEEGEARKRAAEAKTAKNEEELEKKKQQLKYKQAVWDKAASIAQAAINTAMSITATAQMGFPQAIPFIAAAAAMGALQIATILATPIPKYAKGTDFHKGGPALVGDGGRKEVIFFNGNAWLTPDKPTLVDIPRGASVIPDASAFDSSLGNLELIQEQPNQNVPVVVNNDYSRLERLMERIGQLIRRQTRVQQCIASHQEYESYKNSRL